MNAIRDTLFLPLRQDMISIAAEKAKVAIVNIAPDPMVSDDYDWIRFADIKTDDSCLAVDDLSTHQDFDFVFIAIPKNAVAAQYQIAVALNALKQGGVLICAAETKANGSRLDKWLRSFGLMAVQSLPKNRCRVAWGTKDSQALNQEHIEKSLQAGKPHCDNRIKLMTQPGIFGWNKIDRGSALLAQHIPDQVLKGHGADFGCGYGYLSTALLPHHPNVTSWLCIDNDRRAVAACAHNLEAYSTVETLWLDLTKADAALKNLDCIVMNPPFHEGKTHSPDLGIAMIKTAHRALKKGGDLYMVANAHLPYESVLQNAFSTHEHIFQTEGFKGIKAVK